MPFKIRPAHPFSTPYGISISDVYGCIDITTYKRRERTMAVVVAYYNSEADCMTGQALPLDLPKLFELPMQPAETKAPDLDSQLEQFVSASLVGRYGDSLTIELVS